MNVNLDGAREQARRSIREAIQAYSHIGDIQSLDPYGNGHINDTFLVCTVDRRYILQRINSAVFPNPAALMANIDKVTSHIIKKSTFGKKDSTLSIVKTDRGEILHCDSTGSFWRMYDFIENTVSRERVESPADFYICAKAFGEFQRQLADFPASELCETIKDFHNTPARLELLLSAERADVCYRACGARAEFDFAISRRHFCNTLERARRNGTLPLRVTHNDTKLNNILFDAEDGRAVAVIDLDTVMPGYSVNDFGDAIRFGANTAAEDETDLSLVSLDLELFKSYAQGFIEGCNGSLTQEEIRLLPVGAIMMTLECGIRFLTDHLLGDVYFKIHRVGHNLDRARNQFALVADMERKFEKMNGIIEEIINK